MATVCSRFRDELGYQATLKAFDWVKWTTLGDNVRMFGLDGRPPVFDRVYNQADGIWVNYPQAEIKDRFAPSMVRDDRIVRRLWEAEGKRVATRVTELAAARRREEIARMLAGAEITEEARAAAEKLIRAAS